VLSHRTDGGRSTRRAPIAPRHYHTLEAVPPKDPVGGNDGQTFLESSSREQAIERITVAEGQLGHWRGVTAADLEERETVRRPLSGHAEVACNPPFGMVSNPLDAWRAVTAAFLT
jgi:hypothetical protein